jgi:hypothetical protein
MAIIDAIGTQVVDLMANTLKSMLVEHGSVEIE